MNISPRTKTLLDRLPKDHPLTPSMRTAMVAALATAEQFSGHKIALASDGRMTQLGQRQALTDALTGKYGKALVRAKAPVVKARKEIEAELAALVIKPVDPANVAAALERQEIRAWVRTLDLGVRQSVVLATKDRRILEAVVSAPPELSGFAGDAALASKIEDRYIELTYPDRLASIEAKNAVVAEAEASMHISRNEMRATIDLHSHDFDELMKPVETYRPWLKRSTNSAGDEVVYVFDPADYQHLRVATADEAVNGVEYENLAAYNAAQGLAA